MLPLTLTPCAATAVAVVVVRCNIMEYGPLCPYNSQHAVRRCPAVRTCVRMNMILIVNEVALKVALLHHTYI